MSKFHDPYFALSFVAYGDTLWPRLIRSKEWKPWINTLSEEGRAYYQSIYHGNFFQQAFSTPGNDTAFLRRSWQFNKAPVSLLVEERSIELEGIQVFAAHSGFTLFNVGLSLSGSFEVDELIELSLKLKNPSTTYDLEGKKFRINEVITAQSSLKEIKLPTHIHIFQDHTYRGERDVARLESDCFHLANFIPYSGDSRFETSSSYYHRQIEENGIAFYKNWFALSLNDSFVRVSQPDSDPFLRWRRDYFTIYLYNLVLKNYLSFVNSQLANVTGLSTKMERKKNAFIEFLNDTQYHRISTKFLPNELFGIIGKTLGVPDEMQILEKKLQRISNYFKAKRDKAFNTALIVITFLSVFTVIFDISMWFEKIGFMGDFLWPIGSLITAGLIGVIIVTFFIMRIRR